MKKIFKLKNNIKSFVNPRIKRLLRSPLFELRNIREDFKSYLGIYNYPYKKIFIAGLPKSGTTWVENFFSRVPGYVIRPFSGNKKLIESFGIPENGFKYFPEKCYSCIKTHASPTTENFKSLDKNKIEKIIVIYRDPRDVAISKYFHWSNVSNRPGKLKFVDYNSMNKNEAIKHSIMVVKRYVFEWINGWLVYSKLNPNKVSIVRYEDMYANSFAIFKKMSQHYCLNLNDEQITLLLDLLKKNKKGFQINNVAGQKSTFRKGGSGDWKNHFTREHIKLFTTDERKMLQNFGYKDF